MPDKNNAKYPGIILDVKLKWKIEKKKRKVVIGIANNVLLAKIFSLGPGKSFKYSVITSSDDTFLGFETICKN